MAKGKYQNLSLKANCLLKTQLHTDISDQQLRLPDEASQLHVFCDSPFLPYFPMENAFRARSMKTSSFLCMSEKLLKATAPAVSIPTSGTCILRETHSKQQQPGFSPACGGEASSGVNSPSLITRNGPGLIYTHLESTLYLTCYSSGKKNCLMLAQKLKSHMTYVFLPKRLQSEPINC